MYSTSLGYTERGRKSPISRRCSPLARRRGFLPARRGSHWRHFEVGIPARAIGRDVSQPRKRMRAGHLALRARASLRYIDGTEWSFIPPAPWSDAPDNRLAIGTWRDQRTTAPRHARRDGAA